MAMKAVGWLSQNLGWNISGRPTATGDDGSIAPPTVVNEGCSAPTTQVGVAPVFETYLSHVSNAVFGTTNGASSPTASSNPFAAAVGDCASSSGNSTQRDVVENAELDEQGLPKTRNWYYYDEVLGRWNVSPDAPQSVQEEFAERLRQEEAAKNKAVAFPEPPPPPPPAFNASAFQVQRAPLTPQYAVPTYFNTKLD